MYPMKIQKYKCFSCGGFFSSKKIPAICPICQGKGVKIKEKEDSKVSEEKRWRKVISKAKQFIEKISGNGE